MRCMTIPWNCPPLGHPKIRCCQRAALEKNRILLINRSKFLMMVYRRGKDYFKGLLKIGNAINLGYPDSIVYRSLRRQDSLRRKIKFAGSKLFGLLLVLGAQSP